MFAKLRNGYTHCIHWTGWQWIALVTISLVLGTASTQAQDTLQAVGEVRTFYPSEFAVEKPLALSYSATLNRFYSLVQAGTAPASAGMSAVVAYTAYEELVDTTPLKSLLGDTLHMAFDDAHGRLFLLNSTFTQLVQVKVDDQGRLDPATEVFTDISAWGLSNIEGMTVDTAGGSLLFLDGAASQLLKVKLDESVEGANIERLDLAHLGVRDLRGLTVHPTTGHLYLLSPARETLYELEQSGQLIAQFDVSELALAEPRALVFAPSADLTDPDGTIHLFIADRHVANDPLDPVEPLPHQLFLPFSAQDTDSSASRTPPAGEQELGFDRIVEVTLDPSRLDVTAASVQLTTLTLIQTIRTSSFNPPSPDPSGITYLPETGILLVSDGEVDEMPRLFTGKNLFGVTRTGALSYTRTTTSFTNEPAGVAYNPTNKHYFFSSDSQKRVWEVNPGGDGVLNTNDDTITTFSTSAFSSMDPEGLDYDPGSGHLFIGDGTNHEIYRVNPGADRIFNGLPASGGDDIVTHFDTAVLGIRVPDGVDYDPVSGNLVMISNNENRLYAVSTAGTLVQTFDISAANALQLGGVQLAPGSTGSGTTSYYIVDRRVDNNQNPNENDGRIYEFRAAATPPPTPSPTPSPGPSPTPSPTPSSSDVIFADSFESGNLLAWSARAIDSGDLSVSPAAALVGGNGMQAVLDDNVAIHVTDDRPVAEPRYRARFYFDPNAIVMTSGDTHFILQGFMGTSPIVLRVEFRFSNGAYQLRAASLDDATTWTNSSWFTITDAAHFVEVDWRAATAAGANNGGITLWIDGIQRASLTTVDNDTRRIDRVRLGAVAGIDTGTRGTYYFDAFESRRQTIIGPAAGAQVTMGETVGGATAELNVSTEEEAQPEEMALPQEEEQNADPEQTAAPGLYLPLLGQ
jgi:uncharacterized protein YjiK